MPSSFTAGLAQGFSSQFVPEFKKFMQGRRAQQGVNQAADALGSLTNDAAMGQVFKTMGSAALAGGASPEAVTTSLFQHGLSLHRQKQSFQSGMLSQNNSFLNRGALSILGGNISSSLSAQGHEQQMKLAQQYAQNDYESDGRRLISGLLQGQQRTDRTSIEKEIREMTDKTRQQSLEVREREDETKRIKAGASDKTRGFAPFTGGAQPPLHLLLN
jgi:hypothetical protein